MSPRQKNSPSSSKMVSKSKGTRSSTKASKGRVTNVPVPVVPEITVPLSATRTPTSTRRSGGGLKMSMRDIDLDHIIVIPGDARKPTRYQCTVCVKTFKTKDHVNYHKFCQKGKERKKPFNCKQCGKRFITKSSYNLHLRRFSHTATVEKTYICEHCGKGFRGKGNKTHHIRRNHTGEKPFLCTECGRRFAADEELKLHRFMHTGEPSFSCCQKSFVGMTNLNLHILTHSTVLVDRPHVCTYCGKGFGLKCTLDLHLSTHFVEGERTYGCGQCSRAFASNEDLERHAVMHTDNRPYKCWVCCKAAFNKRYNLERHLKLFSHDMIAFQLEDKIMASTPESSTKAAQTPVSNLHAAVIFPDIGTDHHSIVIANNPDISNARSSHIAIRKKYNLRSFNKIKKAASTAVANAGVKGRDIDKIRKTKREQQQRKFRRHIDVASNIFHAGVHDEIETQLHSEKRDSEPSSTIQLFTDFYKRSRLWLSGLYS